jgi:PAS domain S-box-containing protein
VPLLDENGKVREMLGITQDFTERKQMAAEAEEGKRILDALMEYVPEGITIADAPDGRIRMISKFGVNILGRDQAGSTPETEANHWKVYHPDGKTPLTTEDLPLVRAVQKGETVRNAEIIQVSADMKKLILLCNAAPIRSADGQISGGIVAWQDITERKQVEEKIRNMEVQRKLLEYREKERQDIARDLHDGPVQDLSGLIFNIQFTKEAIKDPALHVELEQISLGLKSTVHELRSMINELRPPSLIRFGFSKAMQFHIDDFREKHPEIQLDARLMEDEDSLPEQVRLTLYRILQEGLNNIARHARASQVSIIFHCGKDETFLSISDNGKGFKVTNNLGDYTIRGHFGLVGMHERAESVGGQLVIESAPDQGTKILVTIPTEKAR